MPRRFDGGSLLAALGALLLLVSLFLDWFAPGLSAWTVFEALDMVLAALALATLAAVLPRLLGRPSLVPPGVAPALGAAAFVIVGIQLVDHPPAAIGRDEEVGAWLALAGATLMLIGATLVRTRVTISLAPRETGDTATRVAPAADGESRDT
jgi:hypothetical protein